MSNRARHPLVAAVAGLALCLSACAPQPPVQAEAAPPRPAAAPAAKPPRLAKAKRASPNCPTVRVDLSEERKEALFRQFEAEVAPAMPPAAADPWPGVRLPAGGEVAVDYQAARDGPPPLSIGLLGLLSRVREFTAAGGRAIVLVGPPGSGAARLADALLAGWQGRQTRINNPAPGPLSMKRLLRQLGMAADGTDAPFFGMLAEQAYDEHSPLLVVEDAHTLSPYALSALARVPGLGGPEHSGMVLLLVGEAPLLAKLPAPGLEVLRNPRRSLVLTIPGSPTAEAERLIWTAWRPHDGGGEAAVAPGRIRAVTPFPPRPAPPTPSPPAGGHRPGRHLGRQAGLWALAAATAAVVGWIAFSEPMATDERVTSSPTVERAAQPTPPDGAPTGAQDGSQAGRQARRQAGREKAAPPWGCRRAFRTRRGAGQAEPSPPAPGLAPGLPIGPAPPQEPASPGRESGPAPLRPAPEPTPAQIKREFDAFLDRAGRDTAKLTPAAREALFREYLQWRVRAALAGP